MKGNWTLQNVVSLNGPDGVLNSFFLIDSMLFQRIKESCQPQFERFVYLRDMFVKCS